MKVTGLLVTVALFLLATAAMADEKKSTIISSGQYIRSGDSGTLTIRRDDSGKLIFGIESIGSNCHTCSVSGIIRGQLGYAVEDDSESKCRIKFERRGTDLQISSVTSEECRYYFGARAGFEGIYKKEPAPCKRISQQNRRDKFLKLYRSRDYAKAVKMLEPLISQCSEFLYWIESDNIRNDLALAQLHSGDPDACLETLAATTAASYADEEELKETFPSYDFDNYINVAKAAWFNKSLCEKAKAAKQNRISAGATKQNK